MGARRAAAPRVGIGGGTRLKIVDALAMGTPVVSTSLGAEGIEAVPGQDLILADTAAGFAQATVDLLSDPERGLALSSAGRRLAVERYSWNHAVAELELLYSRLIPDVVQHVAPGGQS